MDKHYITIRSQDSNSFRMEVILPLLPKLQTTKIKKLFQLMRRSPELNQKALEQLSQWLEDYCQTTKKDWALASCAYQLGYRIPPEGRAEAKRVQANNKALMRAVKKAKAAHEKAVKMQKYFTEERNL